MEFKIYPFNTHTNYFSADIMATYKGKWVFCKHKNRTTWEHPSGWIEEGESALEAAKRELFEETGSIEFDIEPLCDYYIDMEFTTREMDKSILLQFILLAKSHLTAKWEKSGFSIRCQII